MANQPAGKAPSDSPALKPYRGKPALRNFRGGNGNVGIIRSPVRAIALPDSRAAFTDLSRGELRAHAKARPDLHRSEWLPIFVDNVPRTAGVNIDSSGVIWWFGDFSLIWIASALALGSTTLRSSDSAGGIPEDAARRSIL
jgi:hypothetical protein